MTELLNHARQTREFPPVRYPNHDPASIIDDWNKLRALRDARGDPVLAPPEAYVKLRVNIAQECRERDARIEKAARLQEEAKIANCALQNLAFDRTKFNSILQTAIQNVPGGGLGDTAGPGTNAVSEEIRTIVEGTILDSSALMRSNIDRVGNQIDTLNGQQNQLGSQIDMLTKTVNSRLGALNVGDNQSLSISQGSLQDAIRQALWDVLSELVRLNEHTASAPGAFRQIPPSPLPRFQELPSTPSTPGADAAFGRYITQGDMITAAMRSRDIFNPRPHPRPRRIKQYVEKLFTKREVEDGW